MSTTQTSEILPLQKAKFTATGLAIPCKEGLYIVDSGASLQIMGLSSLNHKEKNTIRRSSKILDIQTANGIVVSDTQAKVFILELGAYLRIQLVEDSASVLSLGRLCNALGYSYSWPTGETPRCSTGEKVFECGSYQTKGSTIHWILDGQGEHWARPRSTTFYRRIRKTRSIFFSTGSWEWPWACHRRKTSWRRTSLGCHLTWEQLSNLVFQCTQDKRDLVAGMLYLQKLIFHLKAWEISVCETICPFWRRIVESTRCRSSRLLRFRLM